jgi:hypothetical protein
VSPQSLKREQTEDLSKFAFMLDYSASDIGMMLVVTRLGFGFVLFFGF